MPERSSQRKASVSSIKKDKVTVLNPACSSSMVEQVPLAPRDFASLEGKTVYMVDIGWGGPKAGYALFEVMQQWFAEHIPSMKTVRVKKKGNYNDDDPELWSKIKAEGDACIIGLSC